MLWQLGENDKSLERHKIPKLPQEQTGNITQHRSVKETEYFSLKKKSHKEAMAQVASPSMGKINRTECFPKHE